MALMTFREPNQVKWVGSRPGHNGTQIFGYALATNAVATCYFAPAGKAGYIYGLDLAASSGANPGLASLQIWDAVPAFVSQLILIDLPATSFASKVCSYFYPIELPTGWRIRVMSDALLLNARGTVIGWEE